MLREQKNDLFHALNILESIGKVRKYTSSIEVPEVFIEAQDQMIYNACLTLLANIGETIGKLSNESSEVLKSLDLNAIRGMRNRIVHDYQGINAFIVFETIKNDLSDLQNVLMALVAKNVSNRTFDAEEYLLAKNSPYYKYIDFSKIR